VNWLFQLVCKVVLNVLDLHLLFFVAQDVVSDGWLLLCFDFGFSDLLLLLDVVCTG
jgi:hypothetical protein